MINVPPVSIFVMCVKYSATAQDFRSNRGSILASTLGIVGQSLMMLVPSPFWRLGPFIFFSTSLTLGPQEHWALFSFTQCSCYSHIVPGVQRKMLRWHSCLPLSCNDLQHLLKFIYFQHKII